MFHPSLILYPTDFSNASSVAFGLTLDLAQQNASKVLVLHVAETVGSENVTFGEVAQALQPAAYQQRLVADLRHSYSTASTKIEIEYLVVAGDAKRQIVAVAQDHRCELIVLGMHGRTGLKRLLMGSTAEYVVRHAVCPVLTVRFPDDFSNPGLSPL